MIVGHLLRRWRKLSTRLKKTHLPCLMNIYQNASNRPSTRRMRSPLPSWISFFLPEFGGRRKFTDSLYPVPSGTLRQRLETFWGKRGRWPATLLSLLLASALIYQLLVAYHLRGRSEGALLERHMGEVAGKANTFDLLISLCLRDLDDMADASTTAGFFTYRALGMSETYGLRASRDQIVRHFHQRNSAIAAEGRNHFARLALFAKDGKLIADFSDDRQEQPSQTGALRMSPGSRHTYRVTIDPNNSTFLLFTTPVGQSEAGLGYLAGWVPLPQIVSRLFPEIAISETSGKPAEWVRVAMDGRHFVHPRQAFPELPASTLADDSPGAALRLNSPPPGPLVQGQPPGWLKIEGRETPLYLFPSAERRFTLTHIATSSRFFPSTWSAGSPHRLAAMSVAMLGLSIFAFICRRRAGSSVALCRRGSLEKALLEQRLEKAAKEIAARKWAESLVRRENTLLRIERERTNLAIASTSIGLWDWYLDRDEVTINDRWAEMLGYTHEELRPCTYDTWTHLIHPEDKIRVTTVLNQHLRGASDHFSCELRMRRKGGDWLWVHTQGRVVEWVRFGEARRMTGTHADISTRKSTEQRLLENEEKFRAFIESIDDMIFAITSQGQIVYANPAVEKKLGYPLGELFGKHLLELHPAAVREEAEETFRAMLTGTQQTCPLALLHRDGRAIPVETRVWHGKWKNQEVIFGISKDLSGEEEAKQKFERIFRDNPAVMSLSTLESEALIDVNQSFIETLGFSRLETIGKSFSDLALFVDPEQATNLLRSCRSERVGNRKLQVRHRDGRILDGLFSVDRINNQGKTMLLLVMINITDLENAERRLRHVNETLELRVKERVGELEELHRRMLIQDKMACLGQLAAGVAHELNNPISFVANNFSALKLYFIDLAKMIEALRGEEYSDDKASLFPPEEEARLQFLLEDIPDLFEESQRGFERIAQIIGTMREFARTDLNRQLVLFDINAGIEETLTIARNTYKYCAEVETSYGDIPALRCFPDLLKQVFLNLIVNSAQAIEAEQRQENGVIRIATRQEGGDLLCTFEDDGPGIPDDIQHRVFDPFFTTKPPGKGTGLGLSLCYDIVVKTHQGELNVSTPENGKGAIFTLRLPMRASAAPDSSPLTS